MPLGQEALLRVLRIAHEISREGEGISLREAMMRCHYQRIRQEMNPGDLMPFLNDNQEYVDWWLAYCEDKRTSGGYWISTDTCEVGSIEFPESNAKYSSTVEAIANFIVSELDYWMGIENRRTRQ